MNCGGEFQDSALQFLQKFAVGRKRAVALIKDYKKFVVISSFFEQLLVFRSRRVVDEIDFRMLFCPAALLRMRFDLNAQFCSNLSKFFAKLFDEVIGRKHYEASARLCEGNGAERYVCFA